MPGHSGLLGVWLGEQSGPEPPEPASQGGGELARRLSLSIDGNPTVVVHEARVANHPGRLVGWHVRQQVEVGGRSVRERDDTFRRMSGTLKGRPGRRILQLWLRALAVCGTVMAEVARRCSPHGTRPEDCGNQIGDAGRADPVRATLIPVQLLRTRQCPCQRFGR